MSKPAGRRRIVKPTFIEENVTHYCVPNMTVRGGAHRHGMPSTMRPGLTFRAYA
ncbi:MAG: hypothetical protein U0559_09150 [Anaerolineae bacterium]